MAVSNLPFGYELLQDGRGFFLAPPGNEAETEFSLRLQGKEGQEGVIAGHAAFLPVSCAASCRTSAGMGAAPLFRSASMRRVSSALSV